MGNRSGSRSNSDVSVGTIFTGTGLAGSIFVNVVQALDAKDLKNSLEAERANNAVLLHAIARLVEARKKDQADLKRLEGERNREEAASRQAKALTENAQAEAARLNVENATLRGELEAKERESEAKTREIEILKVKLEEQKKAA
jgi:hypothetical protein